MTRVGSYTAKRNNSMYTPDLKKFKEIAKDADLIPVYREIDADLETPVSAYLKIARPPYSFLLESVEGGQNIARYSFIGTEPSGILRTGPGQPDGDVDPLELLRSRMSGLKYAPAIGLPKFSGGSVGYLGYDAVRHFEPRVPPLPGEGVGVPEAVFMTIESILVFDHLRHTIAVTVNALVSAEGAESAYTKAIEQIDSLIERLHGPLPPNARRKLSVNKRVENKGQSPNSVASEPKPNMSREKYEEMITVALQAIHEGELIQTVLSQRFARPTKVRPFDLYRSLRGVNPSPYMYYLDLDGFQIIGTSPELLVQAIDGQVAVHPIAGTSPRGNTPEEDSELELRLRSDEKELAEHIMLLDLGRNDIGRVAVPGTVRVTQKMDIERYSHVMHLVSHVTGTLRQGLDAFDVLRAGFPAGTVSGAPKVRAMELIAELEIDRRGPYAGAVGYFAFGGNMDTAIGIRTIIFKDGVAHLQAGGGVVADSTPDDEYQECLHKIGALMRAIDQAEEFTVGG